MTYDIQCECGQTASVRSSQAGTDVVCACGQTLRVPALSQLRRAKDERSAGSLGPPDGRSPLRRDLDSLDEHTLVMTPNALVQQRMDVDACSRFVGQLHKRVHEFLKSESIKSHFVLQIGYALLPPQGLLLDVQTSPVELNRWQLERLTAGLREIPLPTVVEGPVALVAQIIAGNKERINRWPEFQPPFARFYSTQGPHSLDGVIMQAAELPWRHERGWIPYAWRRRIRALVQRISVPKWFSIDRYRRKYQAWRQGIQVPRDKVLDSADRASVSMLSHWLEQYPRSDTLLRLRGHRRFAAGEWNTAIEDYTEFLKLRPQDVDILTRRGEAFCNDREVKQGLADFEQALRLDPKAIDARVGRGTVYLELSAWNVAHQDFSVAIEHSPRLAKLYLLRSFACLGEGNAEAAIDDLDRCLSLDPHHYEAYVRRAFALQQAGQGELTVDQWLDAIDDDLTRHLDLYDDQPAAWAHRAEVRLHRGRIAESLADCERAVALDEGFGWAYGIRAVGHRLDERWDLAAEDSTRAIEMGLRSSDVYLTRAMCEHEQGDLDSALLDCCEAIELNPEQAGAYEFRGVLQMEQGDLDEAISDFTRAIDLGGDPARCFVNRGNAHRLNEDLSAAIVDYGRAIEHAPDTIPAYLNRALAREQEGELESAIEDATAALRHDPDSATALDIRGRLWQELGDNDRALEDWTRAIAAADDYAPAYFNRGHLLLRLDRGDDAERDFTRLLELCPDWPAAHSSRGSALMQQGELEQAEADFREAIELDPGSAEAIQQQRLLFEAHYHRLHERYSDAVRLASEALQIDDESRWALDIRAAAHWYDEEFVEAVEDYTRVIELDDEACEAFSGRGQVLAELGEYDRAIQDLERALELAEGSRSPDLHAFSLNGKGLALVGLKRFDEAQQALDRSLELCPRNAWAHYNRGLLFYEQGHQRAAAESFQSAISCEQPALTPRKRKRATAFLQRFQGNADPAVD